MGGDEWKALVTRSLATKSSAALTVTSRDEVWRTLTQAWIHEGLKEIPVSKIQARPGRARQCVAGPGLVTSEMLGQAKPGVTWPARPAHACYGSQIQKWEKDVQNLNGMIISDTIHSLLL